MEGDLRRTNIIKLLTEATSPVSGSELARAFSVSRQVIVQDIALLRAINKNILSTNKGYILYDPDSTVEKPKRAMSMYHTDEQLADELFTIVDYGGSVLDVIIDHAIYGPITVDLMLKSRQDVVEFIDKINSVHAKPLNYLTDGNHIHTVMADTEQLLDVIEQKLKEKGYLR